MRDHQLAELEESETPYWNDSDKRDAYEEGKACGYQEGYDAGYKAGLKHGCDSGMAMMKFLPF
jgi:flagellar biosynthesis/type III secretory pathway protein FliH